MKPIATAMVLAAGLGTRLRPLTDTLPKPLVSVAGQTLLDWALDRLADAGVERAVVNLHHLGDKIEAHLKDRARPTIAFSRETERLETGGGIARALPMLGAGPFFAVNADVLWLNGPGDALDRLARHWNDET
ncbi:MAG: sugar phosphate nucleotidyltransferase, partial [Pseudomonadota bacterium]